MSEIWQVNGKSYVPNKGDLITEKWDGRRPAAHIREGTWIVLERSNVHKYLARVMNVSSFSSAWHTVNFHQDGNWPDCTFFSVIRDGEEIIRWQS